MFIDIESLRVRVGLASNDNSKDAEIKLVLDATIEMIENYCDRLFEYEDNHTQEIIHYSGEALSLELYPVKDIVSVNNENGIGINDYHLDKMNGLIHLDGGRSIHKTTIIYDGGYSQVIDAAHPYKWPSDLLLVIVQGFDALWDIVTGSKGGTASSGTVKTIRAGALSLTYDVQGGSGAAHESGLIGVDDNGIGILSRYKRWSA